MIRMMMCSRLALAVLLLMGIQASCVAPNTTKSRAQAGFSCDDSMSGTLEALAPWMIGTAALGGLSYAATPEPSSEGGVGYDSYDEFFPTVGLLATAGLGIWLTAEVLVSGVNALDCSDHLQAHGFDRPLTAEEIRAVEKKIRFVKPESKTESDRERRRRERKERIAKARAEERGTKKSEPWSERVVVPLEQLSPNQQALFQEVQSCDEIFVPEPDRSVSGWMMGGGTAGAVLGGVSENYFLLAGSSLYALWGLMLYLDEDTTYQKQIARRESECDETRRRWETELEILRAQTGLPLEPEPAPRPTQDPVRSEQGDDDASQNGAFYDAPVNEADEGRNND